MHSSEERHTKGKYYWLITILFTVYQTPMSKPGQILLPLFCFISKIFCFILLHNRMKQSFGDLFLPYVGRIPRDYQYLNSPNLWILNSTIFGITFEEKRDDYWRTVVDRSNALISSRKLLSIGCKYCFIMHKKNWIVGEISCVDRVNVSTQNLSKKGSTLRPE